MLGQCFQISLGNDFKYEEGANKRISSFYCARVYYM
jgi:hypothetical protein